VSRYVTFRVGNGPVRPGTIDADGVRAFPKIVSSLEAFLSLSDADRAAILDNLRDPISTDAVSLLAPLRPKKNVMCVGRNYAAHAAERARAAGEALALPEVPVFFTKAPTAIAGPDDELVLSGAVSQEYDWEAELGVVIGERCRDVDEAHALAVVFGYLCLNDLTARDLQKRHGQWFKGKSLDNTCPIGPCIVDAAEFGDPQASEVSLRVNGVEKQRGSTSDMIFPVARIIADLSRGMTLEPGDIIATGTPEGVGSSRVPPEFLRDGDVVETAVKGIGMLRNTIRIIPQA